MAGSEPQLSALERKRISWERFRRIMGWMVLASIVAVICAIFYLKSRGGPLPIHMLIATIAGVGFTMLLATGLMGLAFLSSSSGHDEDVGDSKRNGR